MKAQARQIRETHVFCAVCGRPFTEAEKILADHTQTFQCHHCWNPVRKLGAHGDSHHQPTHPRGRVVPMAGKHRR